MQSEDERERYILSRGGYGPTSGRLILLARIDGGGKAEYDPWAWGDRTFHGAHHYIAEHWDELRSGDVVDARVYFGERETPVESERELL
jgi:hypothetical protein